MRRKSGEARVRPSRMRPVSLRENPLQHLRRNARNRQIRCNRSNVCPLPSGANLKTSFPIPFLLSLMLRICERASSAGRKKTPSSSPSGKRTLSWSANSLHKGTNCFPISRSSIDLDWRTLIVELVQQRGLLIAQGIPSSSNRATKSWHFPRVSETSLTDAEPTLQWIRTSLLHASILDSSQKGIDPLCSPFEVLFARESK